MRGIVSIGRFRKKKEKEEREWMELDEKMDSFECAVAVDTENHTEESAIAVLAAMAELNDAMANNPFGRYVVREQQKRDDDFRKRYKDVFARAPDMPVARIKYFCGVLLKLWPDVEKGDCKSKWSVFDDFFSIYSEGVDRTFSDWCKIDQKTDKMTDEVQVEYPFLQMEVSKDNMDMLLSETLERLISARPEEGSMAKKEFLWELVKLFEICRGILYVFNDEMEARCQISYKQTVF